MPVYDETYNNQGAIYANGTSIVVSESEDQTLVSWNDGSQIVQTLSLMVVKFSLCEVEALQQSKISGGNIAVFQSVNRGTVEKANVKVDGGNIDKFYVGGETEDSTVTGTINNVETNLIVGNINTLNVGR